MYSIRFYRNQKGETPVKDYLIELASQNGKDARLNRSKILDYFGILRNLGTAAGYPFVKPIADGIWELRPMRNRIFFVAWHDGSYVMLHHFIKKTQKTPQREIDKAKREYKDLKERNDYEE